jgi:hypothetical protein
VPSRPDQIKGPLRAESAAGRPRLYAPGAAEPRKRLAPAYNTPTITPMAMPTATFPRPCLQPCSQLHAYSHAYGPLSTALLTLKPTATLRPVALHRLHPNDHHLGSPMRGCYPPPLADTQLPMAASPAAAASACRSPRAHLCGSEGGAPAPPQ